MEPLGYFDHSYESDYPNKRPDEELFSHVAAGRITAHLRNGGEEVTRAMLLKLTSIWDAPDVVFFRDELANACDSGTAKHPALAWSISEQSRPERLVELAGTPDVVLGPANVQKTRGPRPTLCENAVQTLYLLIEDGTYTLQSLKDMRHRDLARLCKVKSRPTALKALAHLRAIVANSNSDN
jgi:hypothetical protein